MGAHLVVPPFFYISKSMMERYAIMNIQSSAQNTAELFNVPVSSAMVI